MSAFGRADSTDDFIFAKLPHKPLNCPLGSN